MSTSTSAAARLALQRWSKLTTLEQRRQATQPARDAALALPPEARKRQTAKARAANKARAKNKRHRKSIRTNT